MKEEELNKRYFRYDPDWLIAVPDQVGDDTELGNHCMD